MEQKLRSWLAADRDRILGFMQEFVQQIAEPPGDTRDAMALVRRLLDDENLPYRLVNRDDSKPNLVAERAMGAAGLRHLVLNGHIDVFPVVDEENWTVPPWSGEIRDGMIYGRGISDMKVGTTASIMTFIYLSRIASELSGKLTLTVVSDEETFGPYGARHLFEVCPEMITGTACLNGEPSGLETVRFGEKGGIWLRFDVSTPGGHGAYPHLGPNAIDVAYAIIRDLRDFTKESVVEPEPVRLALDASRQALDDAYGMGAADVARQITMNVGTMSAGPKVNMIASRASFEVDFRLPNGIEADRLLAFVEAMKERHNFTYELMMRNDPNWVTSENPLTRAVKRRATEVTGIEPVDVVSLGNTDARLWRYRDVPAVIYGPRARGMASFDERVPVDEALNVVQVHILAALDYLMQGDA